MPVPAILRSTSVRLALAVAASFLLAFVLLGLGLRYTVSALLDNDTRGVVRADEAGLLDIARAGGRAALLDELRARIADAPDDADYVLSAPGGAVLAGTLARMPVPAGPARWVEFSRQDGAARERVIAHVQPLPGGGRLLTGQRTRSQDRFLGLMRRAALAATFAAATLGVLAGWLTSTWVARRLRGLDATAARVGEGALDLRAPLDGSGDAFDRLAFRFNAMLDRIQDLLGAVRHATDHIAHDLRTPLTRLRNRLEELRRADTGAALGPALDAAVAETDQLLHAFGALLRLARIEGQAGVHDEPLLDLAALVQDAVELYTPSATECGLGLRARTRPVQVRGDADQLFQMLVNLLDNAIKHAPPGTAVEVALAPAAGEAVLEVADHGPGVPAADRERVFDRFQRLEAHRGSPGTGLGLSLVRAIVQRHGGRVALEDNAPGLRVRLALPLA